jgi:hypothetical protein
MDERVDGWRLSLAGDDQRSAAVFFEIGGDGVEPLFMSVVGACAVVRVFILHAQLCGEGVSKGFNHSAAKPQAVVGGGAGGGVGRFESVEAIGRAFALRAATGHEVVSVANGAAAVA